MGIPRRGDTVNETQAGMYAPYRKTEQRRRVKVKGFNDTVLKSLI